MLAPEPADPAGEREPADARLRHDSEGRGESVLLRGGVELTQRHASLGAGRASLGVHSDVLQPPQVDGEAAVDERRAGDAVTSAPGRHGELVLAGEQDRAPDVLDVRDLRDGGGAPVAHGVPERARVLVALVAGREQLAPEAVTQACEIEHALRVRCNRLLACHRPSSCLVAFAEVGPAIRPTSPA